MKPLKIMATALLLAVAGCGEPGAAYPSNESASTKLVQDAFRPPDGRVMAKRGENRTAERVLAEAFGAQVVTSTPPAGAKDASKLKSETQPGAHEHRCRPGGLTQNHLRRPG